MWVTTGACWTQGKGDLNHQPTTMLPAAYLQICSVLHFIEQLKLIYYVSREHSSLAAKAMRAAAPANVRIVNDRR